MSKILYLMAFVGVITSCNSNRYYEENRERAAVEGAAFVQYCESPTLSDAEKMTIDILRKSSVWGPDCLSIYQSKAVKEWVIINNKEITNIEFVKTLPKTARVDVVNGHLEDISPLIHLPALEYVDLSGNKIKDITPLLKIKNLRFVRIMDNQISSLKVVNQFPNSVLLVLYGNPIDPAECDIPNKNRSVSEFCFDREKFMVAHGQSAVSEIGQQDLEYLVRSVLRNGDVYMYLHTEVFSKVELPLYLTLNGKQKTVELLDVGRPIVMHQVSRKVKEIPFVLKLDVRGDFAVMEFNYSKEAIFGTAYFSRKNANWSLEKIDTLEQ